MKKTFFERAIFLSWYCSKGDCKFCFMSTQKKKIRNPRLARRTIESILTEAIITKECGWKIEFLSGGYESYTKEELLDIIKKVKSIYGKKLWLNIGVLNESELKLFKPYVEGICGTVEIINPELHDEICPSKPIAEIEKMFKICDKLRLKKSITIVIGLGEKITDFLLLKNFINECNITKITFYRLNPHKGTPFTKGPDSGYYADWIRRTRNSFPKLNIVAGSWTDRLDEIPLLLEAGADSITKFPALKLFSTKPAKMIEQLVKQSGRTFAGTMTQLPEINIKRYKLGKLEQKVKTRLDSYLSMMRKNQ
ncbi:radical SAM protein [Candidatus Woesearchaeota archaeon]|nr:radical SAM protein [Candidatus Woesearchaeota archaeon]